MQYILENWAFDTKQIFDTEQEVFDALLIELQVTGYSEIHLFKEVRLDQWEGKQELIYCYILAEQFSDGTITEPDGYDTLEALKCDRDLILEKGNIAITNVKSHVLFRVGVFEDETDT